MRYGILFFLLAATGSTACGARTDLLGSGAGGGTSNSGSGTGGTGPIHLTGPQVQTALAGCELPHGPAVSVTTVDDEQANLVGTWLLCPASADAGPMTMFSPGIVLGADGSFETLASDGAGGLVPGMGVTSQGQFSTFCETESDTPPSQPCPGIVVTLQTVAGDSTPAGCFGGPVSFESAPRRMHALDSPAEWCSLQSTPDFDLWLVPAP